MYIPVNPLENNGKYVFSHDALLPSRKISGKLKDEQLHNYFKGIICSYESFATAEIFIFSKSKIIFLPISAIYCISKMDSFSLLYGFMDFHFKISDCSLARINVTHLQKEAFHLLQPF